MLRPVPSTPAAETVPRSPEPVRITAKAATVVYATVQLALPSELRARIQTVPEPTAVGVPVIMPSAVRP